MEGTSVDQINLYQFQINSVEMSSVVEGSLAYTGAAYYCRAFKERSKDRLDANVLAAQAAACRKEWSLYLNFPQMYNLVCKQIDEAGGLEDWEKPVWTNLAGEIVNLEAEMFGEKVSKILKHPEYVLFVDEAGKNTNMKDDDCIGGKQLPKSKRTNSRCHCGNIQDVLQFAWLHCHHRRTCDGCDHFCGKHGCDHFCGKRDDTRNSTSWYQHPSSNGRRDRQHLRQLWPWQTISWRPNLQLSQYYCPPFIWPLQPQRRHPV